MSAAQGWSRRGLLGAGVGAPLTGGWSGSGDAAAPSAPVADAHVHLFNASDLPVANFVKHVILYRALGGTPPRWPSPEHGLLRSRAGDLPYPRRLVPVIGGA